jgi:hypothetical protein
MIRLAFVLVLVSCNGSDPSSLCDRASDVAFWCGGDDQVTDSEHSTCASAVAGACTDAERQAYVNYYECSEDRCRNYSPNRQIALNCDAMIASISVACFTAGILGNSDYRRCDDGTDECRAGSTCVVVDNDCS